MNAGLLVSTLQVSACWPPSRRVTARIAADEPARRRTSSSAPDDGEPRSGHLRNPTVTTLEVGPARSAQRTLTSHVPSDEHQALRGLSITSPEGAVKHSSQAEGWIWARS